MIDNRWTKEIKRLREENEALRQIVANYEQMEEIKQGGSRLKQPED